jgi:hypothetical protein
MGPKRWGRHALEGRIVGGDDRRMERTSGADVETAELNARENAAQTFIVERGYDKEGVWMAMGPIKGARP